jgi:hypothetical protein
MTEPIHEFDYGSASAMNCQECGRGFFFQFRFWKHVREHHPDTSRDDWEFRSLWNLTPPIAFARIKRKGTA